MLAIVIPYYKLTFFKETLDSLKNQTDKRFKVYIGDDESSENLYSLLGDYKGKFKYIYHRFKKNLGSTSLVQQWGRCIKMIGDEKWIMILGDDDVLEKNVIKFFYESLLDIEKNKISVVRFATRKINKKGICTSNVYYHPKIELATDFLFRDTRSSLSEYVFNRKQVNSIGFKDFPLGWYSDILAVLEFSNFQKIFTINNAIVDIRISNLSISGNQNNLKLKFKSKFEFYYYLLNKKVKYFTFTQANILKERLINCYLNDKRNFILFLKITKFYITNFLIKEYILFVDKIIWSLINKK